MNRNEIRTQRLLLRPVQEEDMQQEHMLCSDPEVNRYMRTMPHKTMQETHDRIDWAIKQWQLDEPDRCEFAVLLNGVLIGDVALYIENDRLSAGLGWMFFREYWGQGYATEAARALVQYARDELGLKALYAECDGGNTASYRVMEKLGMRFARRVPGRKNRLSESESESVFYEMPL